MSAAVTIPEGITVILDGTRHDLVPGTCPVHVTAAQGGQVPAGDRPHFLEIDLPTAGTTGIGVILVRIPAYEEVFEVQTTSGPLRLALTAAETESARPANSTGLRRRGSTGRSRVGRW